MPAMWHTHMHDAHHALPMQAAPAATSVTQRLASLGLGTDAEASPAVTESPLLQLPEHVLVSIIAQLRPCGSVRATCRMLRKLHDEGVTDLRLAGEPALPLLPHLAPQLPQLKSVFLSNIKGDAHHDVSIAPLTCLTGLENLDVGPTSRHLDDMGALSVLTGLTRIHNFTTQVRKCGHAANLTSCMLAYRAGS